MTTYKVYITQKEYFVAEVEADDVEEAQELASEALTEGRAKSLGDVEVETKEIVPLCGDCGREIEGIDLGNVINRCDRCK